MLLILQSHAKYGHLAIPCADISLQLRSITRRLGKHILQRKSGNHAPVHKLCNIRKPGCPGRKPTPNTGRLLKPSQIEQGHTGHKYSLWREAQALPPLIELSDLSRLPQLCQSTKDKNSIGLPQLTKFLVLYIPYIVCKVVN